jgi:signal transduction histidine kinase
MMPEMDGYKVCQCLKENVETRNIPVIFLTARSESEDLVKGFEVGGSDFVTKPFNSKELLARVKAQMDLQKLQKVLRAKNRSLLEEMRLRKQRENELVEFEKSKMINILAGGIAHEFNNLLQVILGYGEIISDSLEHDQESFDLQQTVMMAGKKAAKFVEQLMLFADQSRKTTPVEIDLVKFLEDRISLFRGIFSEDIEFAIELPEEPQAIIIDKIELSQLLMNIFLNSSEAMSSKGKISIKVSAFSPSAEWLKGKRRVATGDFVHVKIEDNGVGMSRGVAERAFNPFFSFNKAKGLGLGLSVVSAVIRRLDGEIEIDSEVGKGTSISLFLPRSRDSFANSEVVRFSKRNFANPCGNGELILLAEDELQVANLEKRILEDEGYRVIVAKDGVEAIELFNKYASEIRLVLLDVGMPKRTGVQVGEEISRGYSTPIVYCTAYNEKMLSDLPADRKLIHKPFDRREILSLIRKTIQN